MTLIHKILKATLLIFVGVLWAQQASAQTADSYFHGGAQSFIGSDLQGAISKVQEGLNRFPNDPKLNELLQKLEEEQEKQQQQQEQQNQDQQEQNQDQQQQQEQEQEGENEEQQEQQEQNEDDQQNPENQEQQPQPQEMGEMSKEDAQKILQALAQKEKELLKEFKKQKPQGSATHDKDW